MMLRELWYESEHTHLAWYAMHLKEIPDNLLCVLWPKNTQAEVEQLFISAYEKIAAYEAAGRPDDKDVNIYIFATSVYNYADLKHSWLYKMVSHWYFHDHCSHQNSVVIKQAIFDLSMLT